MGTHFTRLRDKEFFERIFTAGVGSVWAIPVAEDYDLIHQGDLIQIYGPEWDGRALNAYALSGKLHRAGAQTEIVVHVSIDSVIPRDVEVTKEEAPAKSVIPDFAREFSVRPAYDHREHGGGQHNAELVFVVRKGSYAVEARISTGWIMEMVGQPVPQRPDFGPVAYHLVYHTPDIRSGGSAIAKCHITGGECYSYSGSANGIIDLLIQHGSEAVWKRLERQWNKEFGKLDPQTWDQLPGGPSS